MARKINQAGLNLIKRYEGVRLTAYKLPGEPHYTIGYGDYGPHVKQGQKITLAEAERRLRHRIDTEFAPGVERLLKTKVNDNRFSAMVSLAYNIGLGAFASSSVLRYTNQRRFRRAAASFGLWVRGMGNQRLLGLVRRRASEARLYRRPVR
jgi:lysozyme